MSKQIDQVLTRSDLENFSKLSKKMWASEPKDAPRVAADIPAKTQRLKQLGNAVVPQIPQFIGYSIMDYEMFDRDEG
tara:strand:+ start:4747 stop:4977 length:231 start_codon:yes stop_codon:yes gene_type:complete